MRRLAIGMLMGFVAIVLIGCSSGKAYDEAMEKGMASIEKREFAEAVIFFKEALGEKPDDEKASVLLEECDAMVNADANFEKGEFEEAKNAAAKAMKERVGSEVIHQEAKKLLNQINNMEEDKEALTKEYLGAKRDKSEGRWEEASVALESILEKELGHPFFADMKAQSKELLKGTAEAKAQAVAEAEAKAKAEEEAQMKARAEAEALAEKERARQETSKGVGPIAGYWVSPDGTEACHFTDSYLSCAVKESDVMGTQDVVNSLVTGNKVEVTFDTGDTTTYTVNGNMLSVNGMSMRRASKEEANGIYEGYYELP